MTEPSYVDAHAHVSARADTEFLRSDTFPKAPSFTAPVEHFSQLMDSAGVGQAVLIQPSLYGFDHSYLLSCLRQYPSRFAGIALANPRDPAYVDELTELVREAPVRGIRLAPLVAPDLGWFDSSTEPLCVAAASLQLSMNLLITPASLPAADTWIGNHPELTVVIDHVGRPDLDGASPGVLPDGLLKLSRFENVYVKLSALPEMSTRPFPHDDVWPWVRAVVAEFGADRLLWGSDFPFTEDIDGYTESRTVLDHCVELSAQDRARVLSGTARELYRLPGLTEGTST
ncbi:MAG: L-fuconolactonase [Pseudonocardiales bacterium]|nr:L-fuconolactonase [Pseudonocardiales bacterium]